MTILSGPTTPAPKICRKCGEAKLPTAQNFYRNAGGKHGLTPRCKLCVNEDNKASHAARKASNPDLVREQSRSRSKRHYHSDIELSRARQRASAKRQRDDAEVGARIRMRKRGGGAGLTLSEFADLLESQEGKCAICRTEEPAAKAGAAGWNVDHCHQTGRVRFILCGACNRGLGAFQDNPSLLRRAAVLIDDFHARPPTAAILEGV